MIGFFSKKLQQCRNVSVPYSEQGGFAYGLWLDRKEGLEKWFELNHVLSPNSSTDTEEGGHDDDVAAFVLPTQDTSTDSE